MERIKRMGKRLLVVHWAVALLLALLSAVGLLWVFLLGGEASWLAYPIYALSFYALTVVCVALAPAAVRWGSRRKAARAAMDAVQKELRFRRSLFRSLWANLAFALFNLATGVWYGSVWLLSVGLYNLVLMVIHGVLYRCERRFAQLHDTQKRLHYGWRCFQICGLLLLALHATMTGLVFQMIWRGAGKEYPGVMVFAMAAYTFYRLILAIVRVVQGRRLASPVLGAARNVDLSAAMMSILFLQTALLSAFGGDEAYRQLMNALTGGTVCLLAMLGAVGMLWHGANKKKEYAR